MFGTTRTAPWLGLPSVPRLIAPTTAVRCERPATLLGGAEQRFAREELDMRDAGLAAAARFEERLQHFEAVEIVNLEGAAVDADGFFDHAIRGQLERGPTLRERDRAAGHEWDTMLTAGIEHLA